MNKWRLYFDYEKEEKWINSMAQTGQGLVSFTLGKYTFMPIEPGEYIYRIELLDELPSHQKSKDYIEFNQELGIEVVDTHARWIFFRRKSELGPFEIHSDKNSLIKHLKSIMLLYGIVGFANLIIGLSNLPNIGVNIGALILINITLGLSFCACAAKYLVKINDLKKEQLIKE